VHELDHSVLFLKVYDEEYGAPGGLPYGLLVGDYEFDHQSEDMHLLRDISIVARVAHAPFVAAASPRLFGGTCFTEMTTGRDLAQTFAGAEYAMWRSFRESEDSRYVALTLPRVLARLPYGATSRKVDELDFEEFVDGGGQDQYLWMSAAWAYAVQVTHAFDRYAWLARTVGVEGGGKVEGLPVLDAPTDYGGRTTSPTEIALSDRRVAELSVLGVLPLGHDKGRDCAVFLGAHSCHHPQQHADAEARASAAQSARLNYLLCVSRFLHYLRMIGRDCLYNMHAAYQVEDRLNEWLCDYILGAAVPNATNELQARFPLASGRVEVRAAPSGPFYNVRVWLCPHFQFEEPITTTWLMTWTR
jgi:type VI secretion system protein ImpC